MKGGNEHKHNMIHGLVNVTVKPQQEKVRSRSKSPAHKFRYQLPQSFFEAVDNARVEAGYDILPRFHNLSVSKSPHRQKSPSLSSHRSNKHHRHSRRKTGHKHSHSSSTSDKDDASRRKIRLHRTSRKRSHHHHHHHKDKSPALLPNLLSGITVSDVSHILSNLSKNFASSQSINH